jgi:hypothetical protein
VTRNTRGVLIGAIAAASGCSGTHTNQGVTNPVDCTTDSRPGLVLSAVDSATGQAITSSSLVIAQEGAFADTARIFIAPTYYFLYERAGTYVVTVAHTGYAVWRRSGVTVTADQCHVQRVTMTAALQP